MGWKYLKNWTNKPLIITVAIVLISALAIYSNIIARSFTSDDVAHQTLTYNLTQPGPHTFGVSNESFVFKLPVYLVFNALMHPGHLQLILESLLFNGVMVIILALWWRATTEKSKERWLIFSWLIAAGVYWMAQTVNPNTRNLEIGLMLLFAVSAIRTMLLPLTGKKTISLYATAYGILAGILTYNDPYFLFFVVVPLFIAICIYFLSRKRPFPILIASLVFILCIFINALFETAFKHLGFNGVFTPVGNLGLTLVPSVNHLVQILNNSYLSLLLGAGSSTVHSNFRMWLGLICNFGVVCLATYGLGHSIYKRKFSLFNIWLLVTFVVTIGYDLTSGPFSIYTTRYLIILVPLTALFVLSTLKQLAQGPRKYYKLALLLISLSICFNILQSGITIYQEQHAQPNSIDYKIVAALEQNHVTKSYGDYWVANIAYYLSDYKANVLPTICINGNIYDDLILLDTQRFNSPSKVTAVIVSPDLVVPSRSPFVIDPSCTVRSTITQLGEPQKIVSVAPSVSLLIYGDGKNSNL